MCYLFDCELVGVGAFRYIYVAKLSHSILVLQVYIGFVRMGAKLNGESKTEFADIQGKLHASRSLNRLFHSSYGTLHILYLHSTSFSSPLKKQPDCLYSSYTLAHS